MEIYQDFEEFLELLKENGVEYLVIGGYATSIHSRPKYTKDVDIWVNCTKRNAVKLLKVLDKFGTGNLEITMKDLLDKDIVIQLGYAPVRIDILKVIPGVTFREAYENRVEVDWGSAKKVNFISVKDLMENKKQTGRAKDLEDIKWVEKYGKRKKW